MIDLDGDGVELVSRSNSNAYFDLDGDGFAEQTGWVKPDDGLLAVDRNGNGLIDDISELFGSATQSGFNALKAFDTNNDGKVNAQDSGFGTLKIWRDLDGDGVSDAGELQSLTQAGISSISVTGTNASTNIGGNQVVKTGSVTFSDGTVRQSAEVLFDMSQVESRFILPQNFSYDTDVFTLPTLRGFGEIPDLWVSMSMDDSVKAGARTLIAEARTGDFAGFVSDFDGFLADWAGVPNATWLQDAANVSVTFAYDSAELAAWYARENDGIADPNPYPAIRGYVFMPGGGSPGGALDRAEIDAWLAENSYSAPGLDIVISSPGASHPPLGTSLSGGFASASLSVVFTRGTLDFGPDPDPAPTMDAAEFAFLQKLMGQEFSRGGNFIAPEWLLVSNPTPQQVAELIASYSEVRDYMMARFLAQAAHTILAEEGGSADLGGLAPFQHIYYEPFQDKALGDIQTLASDLVTDFRNNPQGTDADALDILRLFVPDFKYVGAYVAAEFPDMDRTLLSSVLETGQLLEGTSANETLSLAQAGTAIGYDGDDSLSGSSGSDVLMGGNGNDTMSGGAESDYYLIDKNEGADRIAETGGSDDTIRFAAGITLADLLAVPTNADGDTHDDLTFSFANGTGSFTIEDMLSQGPAWNTNIHNASQIEWFEFADGTRLGRADFLRLTYFAGTSGADDIRGTYFDDTISGGAGNDTLKGGEGSDLYLIDKDQGAKLIVEGGGSDDTIRFAAGVTLADILAVSSNADGDSHYDLTFSFANGTGGFTIEDMLSQGPSWNTSIQSTSQIEWFEFADGTRLSRADFLRLTYFAGTAGADDIRGTFFDDAISGGAGNDTLRGGEGNDTYLVNLGQGDDRIIEGGGTDDTVHFAAGITLSDILAVASNADGDSHYDLTFSFANGSGSFTIEDMLSQGPAWNTSIHITSQIEWFEFDDGTRLSRADFLTLTYFVGTGGAEDIRGTIYDDTLSGGSGNDTLRGGEGNDLYLIDKGQGAKLIIEGGGSSDTIRFAAGIVLADILGAATNADGDSHYDLTFSFLNGTGSFTIEDMLSQGPSWATSIQSTSQIEWFEFADGTRLSRADFLRLTYFAGTSGNDNIQGTFFDDTMTGGLGNDTLSGLSGNDRYLVSAGQGDDRILEGYNYTNDRVVFGSGIALADLQGAATDTDGNGVMDLTVTFANGTGSITLEEVFRTDSWAHDRQVDWFEFADGTVLSHEQFFTAVYHNGTAGNDVLEGTANNDTMSGGLGNDLLKGSTGNDSLSGGEGDDTLDGGTGNDSMTGGLGNDTYIVDAATDIIVEAAGGGTDLIQSSVTLTLGSEVENLTLTGTGAISGNGNGLANRLTGNAGANTLSGGAGADTVDGGAGNDILTGGADADHFLFTAASSGVDTITDFNQLDGGADEFDVLEFQGLLVGSFTYLGTGAFSGGSDNSEARVAGNQVLIDTDGNGTANFTLTLTGLTSASQIGADDFLFT